MRGPKAPPLGKLCKDMGKNKSNKKKVPAAQAERAGEVPKPLPSKPLPAQTLDRLITGPEQTSHQEAALEAMSGRNIVKIVLIIEASLVALYLIHLLLQPLLWIVIAGVIAISLSGPVSFLSRRMPRSLSVGIVYLALVLLPVGIGLLIVPPLISQLSNLGESLPDLVGRLGDSLDRASWLSNISQTVDIGALTNNLQAALPSRLSDLASLVGGIGLSVANFFIAVLVVISLSIFFVARGHQWIHDGLGWLPDHLPRQRIERALEHISSAVSRYVMGAIVQGLIAGVTSYIILRALGVPFAGGLAIIIAIADVVPVVGSIIASVFVGFVTLAHGFPVSTIIWTIWAIGYQQVENNIIQPRIQSKAASMNAVVILISVLFGAALLGIVGALLAIPVAATIKIAGREWFAYKADQADNQSNDNQKDLEQKEGQHGLASLPAD